MNPWGRERGRGVSPMRPRLPPTEATAATEWAKIDALRATGVATELEDDASTMCVAALEGVRDRCSSAPCRHVGVEGLERPSGDLKHNVLKKLNLLRICERVHHLRKSLVRLAGRSTKVKFGNIENAFVDAATLSIEMSDKKTGYSENQYRPCACIAFRTHKNMARYILGVIHN